MKLSKDLNLFHVFAISSGAMMSGLFILPGLAFAKAGPAILVSYLIAAVLACTGMLSQAELASAMPRAGGTYIYVTRSMGAPVGAVYGIITWFSLALKSAYELFFIATLAATLIHFNVHVIAILVCLIFLAVNIVGIKEAGRMQVALVTVLLAVLILDIINGFPKVRVQEFTPFVQHGSASVIATAGFIFISYGGLLKVASLSEEVQKPGKVIPMGMILSFLIITIIYLLVVFVVIGTLGGERLANALNPLSDAAEICFGTQGKILLSVAAVVAIISAANTGIMSASRYPFALSRDEMLPGVFSKVSKRFKTPHSAILMTGLIIIISMFLPLQSLVKAASSVLILTYIFTCLAVIILREGRLQNYQPCFRSPLYPWVQIAGTIGFIFLLVVIGKEALLSSIFLIIGGLIIYWFFGRIKTTREFALLHLIERITAKELTKHSLETELKEIIRERDVILKDRFDDLVEACHVLDINEPIDAKAFFKQAADVMSERLGTSSRNLYKQYLERERESSTVLTPYLAIPHVIIEGNHAFDLLLARCREGIYFCKEAPKVHAVFMLVGSRDERPFHLRALAAIAQIVQDPDFDNKWMQARNVEALRDIVLLGKRRRE